MIAKCDVPDGITLHFDILIASKSGRRQLKEVSALVAQQMEDQGRLDFLNQSKWYHQCLWLHPTKNNGGVMIDFTENIDETEDTEFYSRQPQL